MFATRGELLRKIRLGEDTYLELKEVRFAGGKVRGPEQGPLADEIAAFANTRGGVLLLGVKNKSREVSGIPIEKLDAIEALVTQACEDSIDPPAAPLIERMLLPDSNGEEQAVIRVEVAESVFVHRSPGGYFHRVGSSKRPIASELLARLYQQRSQSRLLPFDETAVPDAAMEDLDERLWRRFWTPRSTDPDRGVLGKLGMASLDDTGSWHPTVAGVLLASREPRKALPNAFIQAVAYRGTSITSERQLPYQRDARDIVGPLDEQVLDACDFVDKNMWMQARKMPTGGRQDLPQYDMIAVFEALTNAVAHRDYAASGSKVRLRLFDDRMELYTPGMLANQMTPELLPHRQVARNQIVTGLLARCPVPQDRFDHRTHFMDRRGEGVPMILDHSEDLSGKRPTYRMLGESELLLTIHAASYRGE